MRALVLALALILLGACGSSDSLDEKSKDDGGGYETEETEINGMPCIVVKSKTYNGYKVTSIDCDWSKRESTGGGG